MNAPIELNDQQRTIIELGQDLRLAHKTIFRAKHPQETPPFHYEIMELWRAGVQHALIMAFRGAGKSTIGEEHITLAGCYRRFTNCLILADTWTRAVEHLQKIRNEYETNPLIETLFGSLVGSTWTDEKLVLANGLVIQALGRGQSLRGTKHLDWRPDYVFIDDVEDVESTQDMAQINKTMRWLMSEVIPALAPGYRLRMNGTPLHPHSVLMQMSRDPAWIKRIYPIEYRDQDGKRQASWPARFPLEDVDKLSAMYARRGMTREFMQEYMCEAEDVAAKPFASTTFKIEPLVRTWQNTFAVYDPARTTAATSAMTGKVVYSWMGNRLVVWSADGQFWKPDEIVSDIFATFLKYGTASIFVEEDGLNEWLLQPIRQEQTRRSLFFPITGVKAPRGKIAFINQLQPFFKAGEIVFAQAFPELQAQLQNFPTGRIDIPNALAYALKLRPGLPVYESFDASNFMEEAEIIPMQQVILAVNASTQYTTAALLQIIDGGLRVYADWLREGDPGQCLQGIVADAGVFSQVRFRLMAPIEHFERYGNTGLVHAAARVPCEIYPGGPITQGRNGIRKLLGVERRGHAAVQVASTARWTLNAMAGAHAFGVDQHTGQLLDAPTAGPYRTLMEGVESVAALLGVAELADDGRAYDVTADGRRFLTSRGGTLEIRPTKADWGALLSNVPRR